jgi:predicted secreted protein
MAPTKAKIGMGTLLSFGNGQTPETFTLLAERVTISGPGFSRDSLDATHMDSPNQWREFISGLKDGGEVTVEANYVPNDASQNATTGALALFNSGLTRNWKLVLPVTPSVTWTLPAFITNFEPDIPLDDKMMLSITLKVAGEPILE